uniref:snRNA-activating protein complex subunit 3 n=1 Tax=Auxenochlorella protothecoides TaxID=3075 RepID=A0A1D1ZPJ3_AUXPR
MRQTGNTQCCSIHRMVRPQRRWAGRRRSTAVESGTTQNTHAVAGAVASVTDAARSVVSPGQYPQNLATEAFRVSDVIQSWTAFQGQLATTLNACPAADQEVDVDTSALAVQSEEDALGEPDAFGSQPPLPGAAAALSGAKPITAALLGTYRQRLEVFHAQRERERRLAAKMLLSVQASPLLSDAPSARASPLQAQEAAQEQRLACAAVPEEHCEGKARVAHDEALLHILVHVPSAGNLVSEEWLVRGSDTLRTLCGSLFCLSDLNARAVEEAENAARRGAGSERLSLAQPSAHVYVEGTFYVDTQTPGAKDCTASLRQYLRDQGQAAPPHPLPGSDRLDIQTTSFSVASMDVPLCDLWLRVGAAAPALYCHQGGCEHVLTLADVRRFDPGCDPPFVSQYPLQLSGPSYLQQRACEVCGIHSAKQVTYDDRYAPASPFFWCQGCFRAMHYDASGTALYTDFRVFPYAMDYHNFVVTGNRRVKRPPAAGIERTAAMQQAG